MDNNLTKARAYFYEFLAYPLFFHEHGGKFDRWREQLAYLSTSPVTPRSEAAFANLAKFDFKFERKKLRRSIFAFRRGGFKFYDGSYLVGSDGVKFKSNDV